MRECQLHQSLKRETHLAHKTLERHPLLGSLLSPTIDLESYRHLLQKTHRFYREIEPQLALYLNGKWAYQYKIDWLTRDLNQINAKPIEGNHPTIRVNSFEKAIGSLYVIEGSTLGSTIIVRHLSRSLPHLPHHFFSGYGSKTGRHWQTFLDFLIEIDSSVSHDSIIAGAQATFRFMHEQLSQEI